MIIKMFVGGDLKSFFNWYILRTRRHPPLSPGIIPGLADGGRKTAGLWPGDRTHPLSLTLPIKSDFVVFIQAQTSIKAIKSN